jgi:6,7-dimethyl-8-ribityllumazine synthase
MVLTASPIMPPGLPGLTNKKIAIVASLFNKEICDGLIEGAVKALKELGLTESNIEVLRVPGAFEIPLVAKTAAAGGTFDGVIALGCVIRGETPHFEFVSLGATLGCLNAGLDTGRPVMFGVLTVNDERQARERAADNEFNKGREAAFALAGLFETLERMHGSPQTRA